MQLICTKHNHRIHTDLEILHQGKLQKKNQSDDLKKPFHISNPIYFVPNINPTITCIVGGTVASHKKPKAIPKNTAIGWTWW